MATFLDPGDALDAVVARNAYFDPSETVESLQAERDAARKQGEGFRRDWLGACADLNAANDTIARLRATHTQAEAARGRCAREDGRDLCPACAANREGAPA